MYSYRVPKICSQFQDEITGTGFLRREVKSAYSYVCNGKVYLTINLKHAIRNSTIEAIREGLASRIPLA